MLMPKRTKFRKTFKGKMKGKAPRGFKVSFGDFGLQAVESGWITAKQIEAARIAITRSLKRGGKVWIRIFPYKSLTKKPAETRQGKGKGSPDSWVAPIKAGRVLYEVGGVDEALARKALRLAAFKLGVNSKIVNRELLGGAA